MRLINRPSPNFNDRPVIDGAVGVRHVVIHYTGMASRDDALARLCDAKAGVSAHYLIDQAGAAFQLVPEEKRAWHAGVSYWRGVRDLNGVSIGIELCNPGHDWGYPPFPDAQIATLKALLTDIRARHGITADGYLGHSDIAPSRKIDPGELFPWSALAREGFGLWPEDSAAVAGNPDLAGAIRRFCEIGYAVPTTVEEGSDILNPDSATTDVIKAFQRRYLPTRVDGHLDNLTATRIAAVAVAHAVARASA